MLRRVLILLLVFAISISPRIPLGFIPGGRRLDLRAEDIVLFTLIVIWLLYLLFRPRLYPTPLWKPLSAYVLISGLSTAYAILFRGLDPIRASFYSVKEVEYFLIFLLVANWLKTMQDIKYTVALLLIGGLLNAIWMVFQLLSGVWHPLLGASLPVGFGEGEFGRYYGPALIGEHSPLSTGGFFLTCFFLALGLATCAKSKKSLALFAILASVFWIAIFASLSRVSILGSVAGVSIIVLRRFKRTDLLVIMVGMIVLLSFSVVLRQTRFPYVMRAIDIDAYTYSIRERWEGIWSPLLTHVYAAFFVGFGKSGIGYLTAWEEAHNYFLRVFLESGFFGLLAFLGVLAYIAKLAIALTKGGIASNTALGMATLGVTVALSLGALFQDIFVPVKVMEPFWLLIGIAAASYRISKSGVLQEIRANSPVAGAPELRAGALSAQLDSDGRAFTPPPGRGALAAPHPQGQTPPQGGFFLL